MSRVFLFILLIITKSVLEKKGPPKLLPSAFLQHDYNVTMERVEVVRYDKNYYGRLELKTFKYNRTCTAFNMTIMLMCDSAKIEVVIQAYKFASNEYRLFPLRFQYNLCKALSDNIGGLAKRSCGNFTGCPISQGQTIHICYWTLDQSKLAPYIPTGRYMLEFQSLYDNVDISCIRSYSTITRPEV